jgi:hypothetical protein
LSFWLNPTWWLQLIFHTVKLREREREREREIEENKIQVKIENERNQRDFLQIPEAEGIC